MRFKLTCALVLLATPAGADETPKIDWWTSSFDGALSQARSADSDLFVYFWMQGSPRCADMYGQTLQEPAVASALADYLCVGVDIGTAEASELVVRYGIQTVPTILFLEADGQLEDAILGFASTGSMLHEIDRVSSGTKTLSALRASVAADPEDLDALLALGLKLRDVGQGPAARAVLDQIRAADPRGATVPGARVALWAVLEQLTQSPTNGTAQLDLEPLHDFLESCSVPDVRFEGWNWAIETETERGHRSAARQAVAQAFEDLSPEQTVEWASAQAQGFWNAREELTSRERKLALELASAAAQRASADLASDPPEDWLPQGSVGNGEEPEKPYQDVMSGRLVDTLLVLARCQAMNGEKRAALATLAQCRELDPGNADVDRLEDLVAKP